MTRIVAVTFESLPNAHFDLNDAPAGDLAVRDCEPKRSQQLPRGATTMPIAPSTNAGWVSRASNRSDADTAEETGRDWLPNSSGCRPNKCGHPCLRK
jgi:hypothetical protein